MTTAPPGDPATASNNTERQEHDAVVKIVGELSHTTAPRLTERLHAAVTSGPSNVVVDLSDCTFVDATALGKLVDTHAVAHRAGRTLILRNCSPRVERLLIMTGLRRVFTVRD